ncbi:AMP-binding protein [Candidatus Micrarchaeota archaeon]|nr:AMP-binding protein [Candidatus Micrarchaeota archaeon]
MGMDILALLRHLASAKGEQWMHPDGLEKLRERRLGALLKSSRNVPAYAGEAYCGMSASGSPMEALASAPILGKSDVRRSPASFLNPGKPLGRHTELTTSGSTGEPLRIYLDGQALAYRVAQTYAVTTEFGRTPFDVMATLYERPSIVHPLRRGTIFRELPLSIFDDEAEALERMARSNANIVSSFPSVIASLAHANLSEGRGMSLKSAYCTGEMLTPRDRRAISSSFGCSVFDQYGLNEAGLVAWECPEEHKLHINSSTCIVEIIDDGGNPVTKGSGDIVVTSLINHMMPLLRYSTGDRGRVGRDCPCGRGFPTLDKIEGRKDDLLVLPSGKLRSASFIDSLSEKSELRAYQLIQESASHLVLKYVPNGRDISMAARKEIEAIILRGCLGESVSIDFEKVDSIKRGRTGKIATVISRERVKP